MPEAPSATIEIVAEPRGLFVLMPWTIVSISIDGAFARGRLGTHAFAVRVRDAGANLDPTPATRTWAVDLTAPDTRIDSGPSGMVAVASASFTFSSNEDATYTCSLDGSNFMPCTSPFIAMNV